MTAECLEMHDCSPSRTANQDRMSTNSHQFLSSLDPKLRIFEKNIALRGARKGPSLSNDITMQRFLIPFPF